MTARMTDEDETTPLSKKIEYMLTEARVALPGVQALLGFQLIAVLTNRFWQLPELLRITHAIGLGMMTVAIIFLLAPVAFHRLAFAGANVPAVHTIGSLFVTAALAALAVGLTAETLVAIGAATGRVGYGALAGGGVLLMLVGLWYVWPLAVRTGQLRSAQGT